MATEIPSTSRAGTVGGSEVAPFDFHSVKVSYEKVWAVCPFTSFAMFDYLVKESGQIYGISSWESFFRYEKATLADVGLQAPDVASPAPAHLWQRELAASVRLLRFVFSKQRTKGVHLYSVLRTVTEQHGDSSKARRS